MGDKISNEISKHIYNDGVGPVISGCFINQLDSGRFQLIVMPIWWQQIYRPSNKWPTEDEINDFSLCNAYLSGNSLIEGLETVEFFVQRMKL